MWAVVLIGLVLGLDSFRASVGLGMARGWARRMKIALAFGLCDGLSPMLGLVLGEATARSFSPWAGWIGPLTLGGFGVLTFLTAGRGETGRSREGAVGTWGLLGLPLALSLDNMVAGFGLGAFQVPMLVSALVLGTISGALALAGLYLGSVARRMVPARAERLAGAALTLLAVGMALDSN
jgi:putative Mn2+ efflux pump MntP